MLSFSGPVLDGEGLGWEEPPLGAALVQPARAHQMTAAGQTAKKFYRATDLEREGCALIRGLE